MRTLFIIGGVSFAAFVLFMLFSIIAASIHNTKADRENEVDPELNGDDGIEACIKYYNQYKSHE